MIPAVLRFAKQREIFFSEHYTPKRPLLIGLCGKAGAGKDTVACRMVEDLDFVRLAFAQPIKQANMALFGLTHSDMEDRILKESTVDTWKASPRDLNQWMGTVMRAKFGEDFFVKSMLSRMKLNEGKSIVISDCRFDNEAEFILQNGGCIWKLDTGDRLIAQNMSEEAKLHKSEIGPSDHLITKVIDNSGEIPQTMDSIEKFIYNHNNVF